MKGEEIGAGEILEAAHELGWHLPPDLNDRITEAIYAESSAIAARRVRRREGSFRLAWQETLDRVLTGRWTGIPVMLMLLGAVLWVTIVGANYPSGMLSELLVDRGWNFLRDLAASVGVPGWLRGILVDGMYLTTAWVVSVMLPPMAIFFPLFTILEDFGYLPRVAFNLDRLFKAAGAHGKQALTMSMGLGCNAAGVIACRIIDSPRERLIAIVTNNFALCNGRWPTQMLIASIFIGGLFSPVAGGAAAAGAVLAVAGLGFVLTWIVSLVLSRTVLRGEASTFSLELPPYRPPNILRTLYTSLIDRTIFVLFRAVVFALPAGAIIWLIANVHVGGQSLAHWMVDALDGPAWWLGLNGVILVAYVVAIPANEIVIPTILMLTVLVTGQAGAGPGVMFEVDETDRFRQLLEAGGWTALTGICLMIFSLCHNPCSTTIFTIWRETRSFKWTALATLLPFVPGILLCASLAAGWRAFLH